jgi:hypothetical protein
MSMTPYEIRLELLKMAKEMLTDDYYGKREVISNEWSTKVEESKINGTPSPQHPGFPPFPSEEEIIKKAEMLNGFVSQTPPQPEVKITKKTNS